jgi:hypothetical protein
VWHSKLTDLDSLGPAVVGVAFEQHHLSLLHLHFDFVIAAMLEKEIILYYFLSSFVTFMPSQNLPLVFV